MVIKSEYLIFGQTIKVTYSRTLIKRHNAFGLWDYNKNKIILQQSTREYPLTKEQIESTFVHEITHACLDLMGEQKLSSNEKFVHAFGNLMHQFIKQNE